MYKKVFSKAEAILRNWMHAGPQVIQKAVSRFSVGTSRRLFFEFLVLIGLLSSIGMIAASRWSPTVIASHGDLRVNGVGVYNDSNCNVATTYLDWGTLEPGSSCNITIYVRNEGNQASAIYLQVVNWNPANATDYMSVSSNYDGRILNPLENVEVKLTLRVSQNVNSISAFSFDLVIGVTK